MGAGDAASHALLRHGAELLQAPQASVCTRPASQALDHFRHELQLGSWSCAGQTRKPQRKDGLSRATAAPCLAAVRTRGDLAALSPLTDMDDRDQPLMRQLSGITRLGRADSECQ